MILQSGDSATGGNDDELVVIYNRVPKTGSTSFVGIAYELYAKNNFHVLHFNISKNKHVMTVLDQVCTRLMRRRLVARYFVPVYKDLRFDFGSKSAWIRLPLDGRSTAY